MVSCLQHVTQLTLPCVSFHKTQQCRALLGSLKTLADVDAAVKGVLGSKHVDAKDAVVFFPSDLCADGSPPSQAGAPPGPTDPSSRTPQIRTASSGKILHWQWPVMTTSPIKIAVVCAGTILLVFCWLWHMYAMVHGGEGGEL